MAEKLFSDELESWLGTEKPKTIESLNETFNEKGFAIIFMLLMFLPALPLPTGGLSHVFEIITMLLAVEMLAGRKTIWLPKRWQNLHIKGISSPRVATKILKFVRKIEAFARPRYSHIFSNKWFGKLFALLVLIFAFLAFIPIPFIGLDTLPSMAVVILSLAVIFEDSLLVFFGIIAGTAGIIVDFTISAGAFRALNHLL